MYCISDYVPALYLGIEAPAEDRSLIFRKFRAFVVPGICQPFVSRW